MIVVLRATEDYEALLPWHLDGDTLRKASRDV